MIKKLSTKIIPDPKRVILMFFQLNEVRTKRVIQMVLSLEEGEALTILGNVFLEFSKRNRCLEKYISFSDLFRNDRELLIEAYVSKEYSVGAAALINPSMIPHPDQSGLDNRLL